MDMMRKGRHHAKRGEQNGAHKLTEATVKQIIADRERGLSRWALSRKYGVPEPTIGRITSGRTWKHLQHVPLVCRPEDYRGSKNGAAKANEQIVVAIRAQYATGLFSHADLARMYRLGAMTISHILHRRTWKHVA